MHICVYARVCVHLPVDVQSVYQPEVVEHNPLGMWKQGSLELQEVCSQSRIGNRSWSTVTTGNVK